MGALEDCPIPTAEHQGNPAPFPSLLDQERHPQAPPHSPVHHHPHIPHAQKRPRQRVYKRPGRRPAAEYEPDPIKLRASCQQRGGTDVACEWIRIVFKDGVTLEALIRPLKLAEIEAMNFRGGFEPCRAYDGFLETADDGLERCLCAIGERVWWKNKKDAVRHLRKFHFGLADQCPTWYVI